MIMSKRKKVTLIILSAIIGLPLLIVIIFYTWAFFEDKEKKFITTVPFNLEQIGRFTKFRSCYGHDAGRFLNYDEPKSSLKHYVTSKPEYLNRNNEVEIYAPFDGRVIAILTFGSDKGVHALLSPKYSLWMVAFDHIYLIPEIETGQTFKAGDLLGYANQNYDNPDSPPGLDFEAGHIPYLDKLPASAFDHMTEDVLDEFKKYGITPENIIISREDREANPCVCIDPEEKSCRFVVESDEDPAHSVFLKKDNE